MAKSNITKNKFADLENKIKSTERKLLATEKNILDRSKKGLNKIPLLLPLLGSFGLVATFYGFEKILDNTDFADKPLYMIALGVILLLLTGAAAKKL